MHAHYQNSVLKALRDQQVRFAPRERKVEQIERAERLLHEIDPKRTYTYEYMCYRITDYRPEVAPPQKISGEEARHDLRLFVEDVSDSADIRAEDAPEQVHTVDGLSKMFNVSSKTISRWRNQGLVSRRFIFDGRKRVGFLQSSVQRFVSKNPDRIKRGERFSQISEMERQEIVNRSRRLAKTGATASEVARRVAKQMERSVETIRYTLKQFDQEHPEAAVFPSQQAPLSDEVKRRIYQLHRADWTVDALGRKFGRTISSIYRIINEVRAALIMELPLDSIYNEEFDKKGAEKLILGTFPEAPPTKRKPRIPADLPQYLASLYDVPLLTAEQEQYLFRKLNYLKHIGALLRDELNSESPKSSLMQRIEDLYEEAIKVKNEIVKANLRLVVSIAKRHITTTDDFFALVSDGNMSLFRAVEKFDYARGNKFSTYASWAIMKNFARSIPAEFKQRDRFRTSNDEVFSGKPDIRSDQYQLESAQHMRKQQIGSMLCHLDEREQKIIINRFGLDHSRQPQTLKQLGLEMGVTKERVRQIEARAMSKLRVAAAEERVEILD